MKTMHYMIIIILFAAGLLFGLAGMFLILSVRMFENRDIASGNGELNLTPWLRGRRSSFEPEPTR